MSDRQRRHQLEVVDPRAFRETVVPGTPEGLLPETVVWWDRFWGSELAATFDATDWASVERLAGLMDLRERARRSVAENMMVDGSKGQSVMNPLARQMTSWDAEIRQLEDRLGMNPRARLNLGITLMQSKKTLDDLMAPTRDPEPESGAEDPRDVINL
jgi:P27 family predicted phage terminase small subunit